MAFEFNNEKIFWTTLKNELITYKLGIKGRGPLSSTEKLSQVFEGDFIDVSEIHSMYTLSLFPQYTETLNDFLSGFEVNDAQKGNGKIMVKSIPGVFKEGEDFEFLDIENEKM